MKLPSGIAFKLAILFLAIGILPMAAVGISSYFLARESMTEASIEYFVERVASDTAHNISIRLDDMREASRLLAKSNNLRLSLYTLDSHVSAEPEYLEAMVDLRADLNAAVETLGDIDLILVVDRRGQIIATSNIARHGCKTGQFKSTAEGSPENLFADTSSNPLGGDSVAKRPWWMDVRENRSGFMDWAVEELVQGIYGFEKFSDANSDLPDAEREHNPEAYSIGFHHDIPYPGFAEEDVPEVEGGQSVQANLIVFYNWSAVQKRLDQINHEFEEGHDRYKSGYTFLFGRDLNTVIGHKYRRLYGTQLVETHGLTEFRDKMIDSRGDTGHIYYKYRSNKIAGFATVKEFGWQLGFGIDEDDIYAEVHRLRNMLLGGGLLVAGLIVILTALFSRKLTRPITNLIDQSNEIARGNLDARVVISSADEIGLLGDAFNKMAEDLKVSNKLVIQAEKAAAWREMARQVAHEIKNPLTPMKLSAQMIQRAHADQHPDFEKLMKQSISNIVDQIDSLTRIAADFSNFASLPKSHQEEQDLLPLIESCTSLYANDENSAVEVKVESFLEAGAKVRVDADEFKRVLLNLINNAFEAMHEGGTLTISAYELEDETRGRYSELRIRDTGRGISADIAERLFEPYFTTRNSGTGLGLAICKKTIEGYGGQISIESEEGRGTTVILSLPLV